MKAKEHTRQVRNKVVGKFKAGLGYKKNPKFWTSHRALFNSSSENRKSMAQLQTYQDMAVHLNWQAGKESINQRSSQDVHGNSGGAAEIHTSGGRICPQDNY